MNSAVIASGVEATYVRRPSDHGRDADRANPPAKQRGVEVAVVNSGMHVAVPETSARIAEVTATESTTSLRTLIDAVSTCSLATPVGRPQGPLRSTSGMFRRDARPSMLGQIRVDVAGRDPSNASVCGPILEQALGRVVLTAPDDVGQPGRCRRRHRTDAPTCRGTRCGSSSRARRRAGSATS